MKPKSLGTPLKSTMVAALVASAAFLQGQNGLAASIGVNVRGTDGEVLGTAGAPSYEQGNWNNTVNGPRSFGAQLALVDSSGSATGANLNYFYGGYASQFGTLSTPDEVMMGGFNGTWITDINSSSEDLVLFNIIDIPYANYNVVIYSDSGNDIDVVTQVRIGSTSIFLRDPAGVHFSETFTEVPSTSNADLGSMTPAGNYTVFTGITGGTLQIRVAGTVQSDPGHPFGNISGFQIVEVVPEPQAVALLGLGAVVLFWRRFSRKA